VARAQEIGARPTHSREWVRKLQTSLHAKAKAEPSFRFYSLWDKVTRDEILELAYRRCRANGGAAGVDGESFARIEAHGLGRWLGNLQEELRSKRYAPAPLLRVWIPKRQKGERPLGIPTIRDRVVQMAVLLVLGPIFEADLLDQQYGFRVGLDAKMAVRRVFFHLTQHGRREVVDADLRDYFNTIPHGPLLKCVARRVADGSVLSLIKRWLTVPVMERAGAGWRRTTEAKDRRRGTPQGGVISPLLANLYFRRFVLAWRQFGLETQLGAQIVNYADDLVLCCRPGNGKVALGQMRQLMERLGLTVNEEKTRLVEVGAERFDFLGYTFGRFVTRDGRAYLGTRPSQKAVSRVLRAIRDETSQRWSAMSVESRVERLNRLLRGWCAYFDQGPVLREYAIVRRHSVRRLRRWLVRKHKQRGTGYRQYPIEYLYGTLGLFQPPARRADLPRAKA
jgi:RNA-directed DNA polymerase